MRRLLLAAIAVAVAGVAGVATSVPAAAQPDAWCIQGRDQGIPGDCSYASYAQCMATMSGLGLCTRSPYYRGPDVDRGRRRVHREY